MSGIATASGSLSFFSPVVTHLHYWLFGALQSFLSIQRPSSIPTEPILCHYILPVCLSQRKLGESGTVLLSDPARAMVAWSHLPPHSAKTEQSRSPSPVQR
jgi:hypothetical protein